MKTNRIPLTGAQSLIVEEKAGGEAPAAIVPRPLQGLTRMATDTFGFVDINEAVRTWWWGERGLVATLFHDLGVGGKCDRWADFISAIHFTNTNRSWGSLKAAHVVVEPSFGSQGFGRPDAVAILDFEPQERFVIFFEAKRGAYAEAAVLPDRRRKGFNSCLNGQLELNHRLCIALEHWTTNTLLEEGEWIRECDYGNHPDGLSKQRKVRHQDVVERLLKPLSGLTRTNYLHVILTLDSKSPFEDPSLERYVPEIFVPDAKLNQWPTESGRFGWISWARIVELSRQWSKENSSLFLSTWAFHGIRGPEDDPAILNDSIEMNTKWTAGRPAQGVSLIFAPKLNSRTHLHFSWKRDNCALRDFSPSATDAPQPDRHFRTHEVLPLIEEEFSTTVERPKYSETDAWHKRVMDVNRSRGL
jgi:hypothetical protein